MPLCPNCGTPLKTIWQRGRLFYRCPNCSAHALNMLKFRRLVLAAIAIVLSGMILPLTSPGQHSVSNPDWEILPTDWGYLVVYAV